MEAISNSIKFLIYSASYQTLPLARVGQASHSEGYMLTEALSSASTSEKWAVIKRKLRARARSEAELPFPQLEEEMVAQSEVIPNSTHNSTRRWVAKKNRLIDEHTLPRLSCDELELVVRRNEKVLAHASKKMRKSVTAGLDNISAPQIKHAPVAFRKLLAFFIAWAAEQGSFPGSLRIARLKHIPKSEKGKFRGISIEDLITKLVEQCVVHPIFPAFGVPLDCGGASSKQKRDLFRDDSLRTGDDHRGFRRFTTPGGYYRRQGCVP